MRISLSKLRLQLYLINFDMIIWIIHHKAGRYCTWDHPPVCLLICVCVFPNSLIGWFDLLHSSSELRMVITTLMYQNMLKVMPEFGAKDIHDKLSNVLNLYSVFICGPVINWSVCV